MAFLRTSQFCLLSYGQQGLGLSIWGRRVVGAIALFCICLGTLLMVPPPAQAALHTYPETDNQTMYRSRLSLRDNQDLSWQVVLFKRTRNGQVIDFNLRLVGFPGQVEIEHPANLVLHQSTWQTWEAPDQTLDDPQIVAVVSSVGQYDMFDVMRSLDRSAPIEIELSLENETRSILVPPYVVKEWLKLKTQ